MGIGDNCARRSPNHASASSRLVSPHLHRQLAQALGHYFKFALQRSRPVLHV
jgi:hypothetical protein